MTTNFSELQFNLNSLKTLAGSSVNFGSFGSSNGSSFTNSIFTLIGQGEAALNSGDEQKAQSIAGLVENLLSMLSGINNESSKAQKEVSKNTKKSNDLENKTDKTTNDIKSKLEEIAGNISSNMVSINDALAAIEELGGKDGQEGEIAKAKEELEKQIQIIEENKEIINNESSSIEEKQKALDAIIGASAVISNLVVQVQSIQEQISVQNQIVEENAANIETQISDSFSAFENGAEKLAELQSEGVSQITTNAATSKEGVVDETAGAALISSGASTSWIPVFGQTASQNAIQKGTDLTAAGATRISGSASNIGSLSKTIGEMGSSFKDFQTYIGSISSVGTKCSEIIGQYNSTVSPLIEATGSWTKVAEANTELEKAIDETSKKIGNKTTNDKQETSNTDSNNTNSKEIFNFDTQTLRKPFGL